MRAVSGLSSPLPELVQCTTAYVLALGLLRRQSWAFWICTVGSAGMAVGNGFVLLSLASAGFSGLTLLRLSILFLLPVLLGASDVRDWITARGR